MTGTPESSDSRPAPAEIVRHRLADLADGRVEPLAADDLRVERRCTTSASLPSSDDKLAADDLVRRHFLDEGVVVGALRQSFRKQRRRRYARLPAAGAPKTAR